MISRKMVDEQLRQDRREDDNDDPEVGEFGEHPEAMTPRDREILRSLATFRRLSQEQVRRLFFFHDDLSSWQAVWRRLQRLRGAKLFEGW